MWYVIYWYNCEPFKRGFPTENDARIWASARRHGNVIAVLQCPPEFC